jgi:GH18 family chitinase
MRFVTKKKTFSSERSNLSCPADEQWTGSSSNRFWGFLKGQKMILNSAHRMVPCRLAAGALLFGTGSFICAEPAQSSEVMVRFLEDSTWDGGYSGRIRIENNGAPLLSGWELTYLDGPEISSLWNAEWQSSEGRTTLNDLGWNGSISSGDFVEIGFQGVGSLLENVIDPRLNGSPVDIRYGEGDESGGNDDTTPNPDFDLNGRVDGADLSQLLSSWGSTSTLFDLDQSGFVDGGDLTILLSAWSIEDDSGGGDGDGDGGDGDGGDGGGPEIEQKVVGYYIEWGVYGRDYQPADMPLEKLTHVNYAFADISTDGRIMIGDSYAAIEKLYPGDSWDQPYAGTYNQLNNVLREEHPHIKTLISVGGWTWSGRFSDVALTASSRALFAESCVEFIRSYNFDGVDIDWEYPVEGGLSSNTKRPEDGVNYTLLLEELRRQLDIAAEEDGRPYLLTIASPAGWDKIRHLEIDRLSEILDFINVMTYDFRGAWDLTTTAHHANMFENPADPSDANSVAAKYNVSWVVDEFLAQGASPEKIVLGIPFYGRAWGGVSDPLANGGLYQPGSLVPPGTWDDWSSGATGVNDFFEIEDMISSGLYTRYWDNVAKVPYLYSPSMHQGHFVSYEDAESLEYKLEYLLELGLGGVMFWEVTADRNDTLLDVIIENLESVTP